MYTLFHLRLFGPAFLVGAEPQITAGNELNLPLLEFVRVAQLRD